MGVYYSGVSKRTTVVNGKRAAFTNFFGKAPSAFWGKDRRWSTFLTKSENASRFHDGDEPVYLIYGNKLEEGVPVAWYRPGVSTPDDGYWDRWTVGCLKKVHGKWTIVSGRPKFDEQHFHWLKIQPYVSDAAMVSYRSWDNRYVFTPRRDIAMSEHTLDADVTDFERLKAHFEGYCEVANERI